MQRDWHSGTHVTQTHTHAVIAAVTHHTLCGQQYQTCPAGENQRYQRTASHIFDITELVASVQLTGSQADDVELKQSQVIQTCTFCI